MGKSKRTFPARVVLVLVLPECLCQVVVKGDGWPVGAGDARALAVPAVRVFPFELLVRAHQRNSVALFVASFVRVVSRFSRTTARSLSLFPLEPLALVTQFARVRRPAAVPFLARVRRPLLRLRLVRGTRCVLVVRVPSVVLVCLVIAVHGEVGLTRRR